MNFGKAINRPVIEQKLQNLERRAAHKRHIHTLDSVKAGIDQSPPPPSLKFLTYQMNTEMNRRLTMKFENYSIQRINEIYANNLNNSKSFHNTALINQYKKKTAVPVTPRSSRTTNRTARFVRGYSIPHYELPPQYQTANIGTEKSDDDNGDEYNYDKQHAEQNETETETEIEQNNSSVEGNGMFDIHPPEGAYRAPPRNNSAKYEDHEFQVENDEKEQTE